MKILLAGGGSGGHVTPLKAIYEALGEYKKASRLEVTVITDRKFYSQTATIFSDDSSVKIKKIFSGKYRRYNNKSLAWHLYHLPTLLKNFRDIFLLLLGTIQSLGYFLLNKPDVVFCKGGFVCVPVGVVAHLFKVPLLIHDSDTRPGLTNRILSRWAKQIATGMPTSFYPYLQEKMIYTGIPVKADFTPVSKSQQKAFKAELALPEDCPVVMVTGGGNGAESLNKLIAQIAPVLLASGCNIVHLTGRNKAKEVIAVREELPAEQQKQWLIDEFADMVPRLLAADVVVTRTSASTIQECANAQKVVIGIASPYLQDQKLNAEFFAGQHAITTLDEEALAPDGAELLKQIEQLLKNHDQAKKLAQTLHASFAKPKAASQLAEQIIQSALPS